jgi:hypothetical protein
MADAPQLAMDDMPDHPLRISLRRIKYQLRYHPVKMYQLRMECIQIGPSMADASDHLCQSQL